jgi:hypothetical protein
LIQVFEKLAVDAGENGVEILGTVHDGEMADGPGGRGGPELVPAQSASRTPFIIIGYRRRKIKRTGGAKAAPKAAGREPSIAGMGDGDLTLVQGEVGDPDTS